MIYPREACQKEVANWHANLTEGKNQMKQRHSRNIMKQNVARWLSTVIFNTTFFIWPVLWVIQSFTILWVLISSTVLAVLIQILDNNTKCWHAAHVIWSGNVECRKSTNIYCITNIYYKHIQGLFLKHTKTYVVPGYFKPIFFNNF